MLKELYKKADFKNNHGMFFNMDCMELMKEMVSSERERGEITLTITDIPYDGVNRKSNGLRSLDKGNADIITFDLHEFLNYLYEITSGTIIVFCGQNQLSEIFNYFDAYAKQGKGTVRQLVWSKCLGEDEMILVKNKETGIITRNSLKDIYRNNFKAIQVYNGDNWVDVYNLTKTIHKKYLEITLRNGHVIKTTDDHKFYVNGEERLAKSLNIGEALDHCMLDLSKEDLKFKDCILSNELFWFIGHFIAEGSYSYNEDGTPKTIQIATNTKNEDVLKHIDTLCKQYGATYCVYDREDSNARNICIHSKLLLSILNEYVSGKLAYGKHFSSKCFNVSKNALQHMLQGYLDGDGCRDHVADRWKICFTRQNYELAYDLQTICALLGYWISLRKGKSKFNDKEYGVWSGTIVFNHNDSHWSAKNNYEIVSIVEKENNSNYGFYDLSLLNEPHKYCLYDGVLTHNCNPSPMNGDYIYLSACENAVWFKKRGATFNAHCKKNVFTYPCGRSKIHPTEKNHDLIKELILDNSNENDVVFDPCAGSGSHLLVAEENNRRFVGCELQKEWFDKAKERL